MNFEDVGLPKALPNSWPDLALFLRGGAAALRPEWRYEVAREKGYDAELRRWMGFETPRRHGIDLLVNKWIRGEAVIIPSLEDKFLFVSRIGAVLELLDYFAYRRLNEWISPFPYPAKERNTLLRELLLDWWGGKGAILTFDRLFYVAPK